MFRITNFNSFYQKYNKKISYAIIASIVFHVMICIFLYKQIISKNLQFTSTSVTMLESELINQNNKPLSHDTPDRLKITPPQSQRSLTTGDRHKTSTASSLKPSHDTPDRLKITPPQSATSSVVDSNTKLENLLNMIINHSNNQTNNVESILDIPKIENNDFKYTKNNFVKNDDIDLYKNMLSQAIQCKFYNAADYSGQKCSLKVRLDPHGKLISVTAISGDTELCQSAIIAVKLANIPKPPSIYIYEIFKNIILNFSP